MDARDYPDIPLTHTWTQENFQSLMEHLTEISRWGTTNVYGPVSKTPLRYEKHNRGQVLFEKVFYGECHDLPILIQVAQDSIEYPISAAIIKWRLEHGV